MRSYSTTTFHSGLSSMAPPDLEWVTYILVGPAIKFISCIIANIMLNMELLNSDFEFAVMVQHIDWRGIKSKAVPFPTHLRYEVLGSVPFSRNNCRILRPHISHYHQAPVRKLFHATICAARALISCTTSNVLPAVFYCILLFGDTLPAFWILVSITIFH